MTKEYYKKHCEEIKKKSKERYRKNREKRLRQKQEYYQKNKIEKLRKDKERYYAKQEEILRQKQEYYQKNKIEKLRKDKERYYKNRKKILQQKQEYQKTQKFKEIKSKRLKNDINFKISILIRSNVANALKRRNVIKTQSVNKYGIDIKAIIEKLGKPPQDGRQYHIDHIFPVSAFDLTNPEHIKLCWHPDNLRWLEASENMSKGNKYNEELFEEYISR